MVNEDADKDHETCPENKLRHNFRLGDITWVKCSGSSWWPAQVIDESCVGSKPKKKDKYDCLVRLYGTCEYLFVDPWKSNSEFETILKQENKSAMEAFREVLEKELSGVNSGSEDGYEEEAVNSKGGDTKGTSKKTTSRKSGSAQKRKGGRARQSSSTHDEKDYSDSSAEGLRNKRQKSAAQSASVGRRERLRQSARSDAKQYLDAAEDAAEGEGATRDSEQDGTPAEHTEIKAMVRDILFKDIIDKDLDAEMAHVNEVINGICNVTDSVIDGGDSSTKVGRGSKQSGSGVEGESSNAPSRGTALMTPEQLSARRNRQIKIMQTLALIAPSGSPFGRNEVAASH